MAIAALIPACAREPERADALEYEVLARDLLDEAAARVGLDGSEHVAHARVREVEALLGARDGDVGETALLLGVGGSVTGAAVREEPLLEARDEDDGILEALGGVDRHERGRGGRSLERVEVGAKREPLEEGGELLGGDGGQLRSLPVGIRLEIVRRVELRGDREEFVDVLDATLGLDAHLRLQGRDEARLLDDGLDHVRELAFDVAAVLDDLAELGEGGADLRREQLLLGDARLAGLEEGEPLARRIAADLVDGGLADAAARRVDDALAGHVVGRVHDDLEVGHDVADLRAVEEARAAHDLVGHSGAHEHVLEDARLRVGAVEHGHIVVARARIVQLLDLRGDPAALIALVGRLVDPDFLPLAAVGEQMLVLARGVVGDHGVGGLEDVARGAVVLLEAHDLGLRVVLLEAQDVGDVGTAPGVDGLVVIAHHHEVAVGARQQLADAVLHVVSVLVLVDADVAEALLVALEHLGMRGEQLEALDEQVVEVERVGAGEALLELAVDLCRLAQMGCLGMRLELVDVHEPVLRIGDERADHVGREVLLVDLEVVHDGADEALRIVIVVDREVGAVADKVAVGAQHAHAHGVERADPHAAHAVAQQGLEAVAHLGGGLVGEGDGEDAVGAHAEILDDVGDAVREHARLARTRAGEHEQRPLGGEHRLALLRVERIQIDPGHAPSSSSVPLRSVAAHADKLPINA